MKPKRFFTTVFVLICLLGILMISFRGMTSWNSLSTLDMNEKEVEDGSVQYPEQVTNVYQHRWDSYKRVCVDLDISKVSTTAELFYSERYRLATKIIPKTGSTALISIFYLLDKRSGESVFSQPRMQMHVPSKNKSFRKKFIVNEINDVVLLATRNPYSRLYSAYIDKVYLVDHVKLTQAVIKHARIRGDRSQWWNLNVTFQHFLDYALDGSLSSHVLKSHYEKIFDSKNCLLNTTVIIIKQESFSADIKHALETVNVKDKDLEVIVDLLTSSRAEVTVTAIVKTELIKLRVGFRTMKVFKDAESRLNALQFVFKRLWSSFQLQGLISSNSDFPATKFSSINSVNAFTNILRIYLSEIAQNPLTSSERSEQRQSALLDAYRHIKPKTMEKIRDSYQKDFLAFEYDPVLPL